MRAPPEHGDCARCRVCPDEDFRHERPDGWWKFDQAEFLPERLA